MSRYRTIHCLIWNDDKFPFASDACQLVLFHLITTPFSSPFGLYKASLEALAAEKRWELKAYREGFAEAFRHAFVKYDERAQVILLPHFLKYNPPNNPNVLRGWANIYAEIPISPLKSEFYQILSHAVKGFGKGFVEAFQEAFAKPMPIQEQEQYQEQKKEKKKTDPSVSMPHVSSTTPRARTRERRIPDGIHGGWPSAEAFVALYNARTPEDHPKVDVLSPQRQAKIREYVRLFPDQAFWEQVYAEMSVSPFLRGQKADKSHRPQKRGLDWLLQKGQKDGLENCVKTFEGKYRDSHDDRLRARLSDREYGTFQAGQRFQEDHINGETRRQAVRRSDDDVIEHVQYRID